MPSEQPRSATVHLSTGQRLPDLRVVATGEVFLHEDCDPTRVARLSTRLRDDGVLRNPPVVTGLPEGGYVVLDGANRTSALIALDARAIPVQMVDYHDPAVRLDVWRHYLIDAHDLADRLAPGGISVWPTTVAEAERLLEERVIACYLMTAGAVQAIAYASGPPLPAVLAQVVSAYKGTARIYRVPRTDLQVLAREYGAYGTLVVFPLFIKEDILEIARTPIKLPTGITRHLISGRALRVNIPVEILTSPGEIDEKNRWLQEMIHQRLLDNRIRYYPEASFLFDE